MKHVLLFEDEQGFSEKVGHFLADCGYHVTVAKKLKVAQRLVERGGMDLVIADIRDLSTLGLAVLQTARQRGVQIFITGTNSSSFSPPTESGAETAEAVVW